MIQRSEGTAGNLLLLLSVLATVSLAGSSAGLGQKPADSLPSWNDGATKQAIVSFVERLTAEGGKDYVPAAERIAVFDNDGTLWSEKPFYFQLAFALDRVKTLAPEHPEWQEKQPFKAVLEGDIKSVLAGGEHALLKIIMATSRAPNASIRN